MKTLIAVLLLWPSLCFGWGGCWGAECGGGDSSRTNTFQLV